MKKHVFFTIFVFSGVWVDIFCVGLRRDISYFAESTGQKIVGHLQNQPDRVLCYIYTVISAKSRKLTTSINSLLAIISKSIESIPIICWQDLSLNGSFSAASTTIPDILILWSLILPQFCKKIHYVFKFLVLINKYATSINPSMNNQMSISCLNIQTACSLKNSIVLFMNEARLCIHHHCISIFHNILHI